MKWQYLCRPKLWRCSETILGTHLVQQFILDIIHDDVSTFPQKQVQF